MRMFHARAKDGVESSCATLKMTDKEYEVIVSLLLFFGSWHLTSFSPQRK